MASVLGTDMPNPMTSMFNSDPIGGGTEIDATTDVVCHSLTADDITSNVLITLNDVDVKDNTITLSSGNTGDTATQGVCFESKTGGEVYHSGIVRKAGTGDHILFRDTKIAINGSTNPDTLLRGNLAVNDITVGGNVYADYINPTWIKMGAGGLDGKDGGIRLDNGYLGISGIKHGITSLSTEGTSYFGREATFGSSTDATSASTGAVAITGGIGIGKNLVVGGYVNSKSTVDSSSTDTGALLVSGGIGVAKTLFAKTILAHSMGGCLSSNINKKLLCAYNGVNDTGELMAVEQGIGYKTISTNINCPMLIYNETASTDTLTGAFRVMGGVGVAKNLNVGGGLVVSSTIDATSTSSAGSVFSGGLGIAKKIYVGGGIVSTSIVDASAYDNAGIILSGGVGIGKKLYVGGNCIIQSTIQSSSTDTGSVVISGGVGVAKNMYVSGKILAVKNEACTSTDSGSIVVAGGIGVSGSIYTGNQIVMSNTTDSTTTTTGTLLCYGGVAIQKNLNVGGTVNGNVINVSNTTQTTSTNTGSLVVAGGIGVAKNMYVGGNLYLQTSGGTSAALNHYEEYTLSTNWAGIWASAQAGDCKVVKIGSICSITIPTVSAASNTAATINSSVDLPARFRPSADRTFVVRVKDNSVAVLGLLVINTSGTLLLYTGLGGSLFTNTGNGGFYTTNVTYDTT